ncbi:hypothetical protein [Streptacidiphilus cavernicola]|uniref:Peptidoglycan binding domain-containing protein n=1 Tax=Streptacidiphilus cavernicola TaxID=3342716 RepID=A0ABV6VUR3_9ACTN
MPSDPAFPRAGQPGGTPPEPPAEEPRTETTLTTRISINIPGSRPIPPVVVRSPLPGEGGGAEDGAPGQEPPAPNGPRHRSGAGSSPVLGVMDSANGTTSMPDLPPEWRTGAESAPSAASGPAETADEPEAPSTWFAPRKKGQPAAAPAPTPPPAAPAPQAAPTPPPAAARPTPPPAPSPFEPPAPAFERPAAQQPPAFEPPAHQAPGYDQAAFDRPGYDQSAFDQAAFDQSGFPPPVYEPPATYEQPQPPDYGRPVYQQQPYRTPEPEPQPPAGQAGPPRANGGRPVGMNSGLIVGGADLPAAPDAMDATMPLGVFDPAAPPPGQEQTRPLPSRPPQGFAPAPGFGPGVTPAQERPAGPQQGPVGGGAPRAPRPSPRGATAASAQADRAAAAQAPAPAPTRTGPPAPPRPSGPGSSVGDGFAGGTGGAGAPPRKESPEAGAAPGKPAVRKGKAASRGRKLVVTAVGLLVLLGGVAYGAGLMLNQADVPKGTTVLGQDIGGDTRDAAVHTLDGTVGVQAAKPLQLVIGGRTVLLQTSVAGLSIDTTATVQGVAHHSYNPADVIESLFGGTHPVPPVVHIDQAKLRSALQLLGGSGAGAAKEGYVSFTSAGDVVTVLPKPGTALDVNAAVGLVEQAYHERAAGLPDHPITLQVTTSQPKVSAAAVKAAAKTLGDYAAKNIFTVRVQGASQLFGKITFSKALTLRPDASGRMVPVFDLAQLQQAYGTAFANVQTKHGGVLGPVTPQDIATALTQLLTQASGSSRTVTLP